MIRAILLFILSTLAVHTANADEATAYLGFNGGDSESSNRQTFENQISGFQNYVFNGKGILLNGGGPNGKMIPVDELG